MAQFEITTPDGRTFVIEGDTQEGAIAALEQMLSSFPAEPAGGSAVNRQNLDAAQSSLSRTADGFASGLMNGATLGFLDEARAGVVGGLMGGVPDGEHRVDFFNYDVPFSERFEGLANQQRARMDQASEAAPFASGLGNVVGAVGPGIAGAARFMPAAGAGLMRNIGAGMGLGAAEGALTGLGNADGADPVAATATGALIGTLGGGAAPAIVAGGRAITDAAGGAIRGALDIASPNIAGRNLARVVNRSGQSVDDLTRALDQAGYDDQAMFILADALGAPGQRALSGVARQPGDGATEIAEYLARRQAGQGDRLGAFVGEALDTSDTARIRDAAMRRQRGLDADVNYSAAEDAAIPVDVRGVLAEMDDRLGPMTGSNVDGGPLDSLLTRYRNQLAAPSNRLPEGVSAMELSDFGRVLEVKQSLSDDIGAAVRAGRNNEARLLTNIRNRLDEALEEASPGYRQANDTFRDQSRALDAIETGAAAAGPRMRTEDALNTFRALPEPQTAGALVPEGVTPMDPRAAFRTGFADPLLARIENSPPGNNSARMFTTPKNEAMMGELANDPALWGRRLQREMEMFETQRRALGGSMTADNMADQADQSGGFGSIVSALTGNVGNAVGNLANRVMSTAGGTNEATRTLIAQALLSRDPQAALAPLLRRAERSTGFDRTVEALLRASGYQISGVN